MSEQNTQPAANDANKLTAVTSARRKLSEALIEQASGLRDDINEIAERLLLELYDAGVSTRLTSPQPEIEKLARECADDIHHFIRSATPQSTARKILERLERATAGLREELERAKYKANLADKLGPLEHQLAVEHNEVLRLRVPTHRYQGRVG